MTQTDQTGPELALAVARIVRPDADAITRTDQQGVYTCWIDPGNGFAYEWRPDLPGAAFDEALEFAATHIDRLVIFAGTDHSLPAVQWGYGEAGDDIDGRGLRESVCRAIVAWGER